ncbi:hypothetical protein ACFVZ3_24420 [Kitasatospora purpeofusca]|uniref:hypothetical protein n=1 Tax=Kitasatospora purpeofusca TaxID=67352 RepID=UPI0036C71BF4
MRSAASAPLTSELSRDQALLLTTMAHQYLSSGEWPTWQWVDTVLDRRGLDAPGLLRSLPRLGADRPGPWYGLVNHDGVNISRNDRVAVTLAGALHVPELQPYFAAPFLDTLAVLVAARHSRPISPNEVEEFRITATDVRAELAPRRDHEPLSRWMARLPELMSNEPVTRNSTGELPNGGRWWGLSRDLGRYRGVTTLEGYVEVTARLVGEHAMPWTQAHETPIELAASAPPSSSDPRQLRITAPIPEELAEVAAELMLLDLLDRSGGQVGRALSPDGFVPEAHARDESGWSVLRMLVDRREVDALQVRANGHPNIVMLTTIGRTKAMNLRRRSQDRAEREHHLHDVLVRWAYNQHRPGPGASIQSLPTSPDWWFCGTEVTWDEVSAAVRYLEGRGLLAGPVQFSGPPDGIRLHLTPDGEDCARSGQTVRTYLDGQRSQPPAFQLTGDNNNIAFGNNNHQSTNFSAHGVSSEDLATLVSMIRFSIPMLGLPEEQKEAVEGDVAALEAEAATGNPDQGRVRTFLQRVGSVVQSVATNPMAQNMVLTGIGTATGLPVPQLPQ